MGYSRARDKGNYRAMDKGTSRAGSKYPGILSTPAASIVNQLH